MVALLEDNVRNLQAHVDAAFKRGMPGEGSRTPEHNEGLGVAQDVQDFVLFLPGLIDAIRSVAVHDIKTKSGESHGLIPVLRELLRSICRVMEMADVLHQRACKIDGMERLQDAATELRFVIAELEDAIAPNLATVRVGTMGPTADKSPAESWYREDFRELRGPGFVR